MKKNKTTLSDSTKKTTKPIQKKLTGNDSRKPKIVNTRNQMEEMDLDDTDIIDLDDVDLEMYEDTEDLM